MDSSVIGDVDCDGDYDEDDIRAGMASFGISEGVSPGDTDSDGDVYADDYVALRDQLGICAADINGDGIVNGYDLSFVIGYWGVCAAP